MRALQYPEVTQESGSMGGENHRHPAFGCITVHQWTGGGKGSRLFGSDLRHNAGITITLYEAENRRSLSRDWISQGKMVADFDISLAQWARLVSSIGDGGGVPVTLRHTREGALNEHPGIAQPVATKKEVHGEEMAKALQERLNAALASIEKLGSMIESGQTGKKALKEIHADLAREIGYIPGTTKFVYDQFAEATEKVAEDAKIEVEAHVAGMAMRLGMEHLRDMAPRISGKDEQ
jgi:hypothetical protein